MKSHRTDTPTPTRGEHVTVVGCGNIGSPLTGLIARMVAVQRLTLVDQDVYERDNLSGQAIRPDDVGRPKAIVQAERAKEIRPSLRVEPIHAAVEDVPWGRLRADVVLACLDSKIARQQVNQFAWRLGVPWVDAGVAADGLLARVTVFVPGEAQPCLECAWDERDYRTLEVKRPCQAGRGGTPTRAPAYLGSLAAALQAAECAKILAGDWPSAAVGRQITVVVPTHRVLAMTFRRNPKCKFDHRTIPIQPIACEPRKLPLRQFMAALGAKLGAADGIQIHLDGSPFARQWRCACGAEKVMLALAGRMPASRRACPRCGGSMAPVGFAMLSALSHETLTTQELGKPLSSLGLAVGDVVHALTRDGDHAFELVKP